MDQKHAIDFGLILGLEPEVLLYMPLICLFFFDNLSIYALAGPPRLFEVRFENSVTSSPLTTFSMPDQTISKLFQLHFILLNETNDKRITGCFSIPARFTDYV